MTAVVDTNVVAYYLLGVPEFVDESRACLARVTTALAPSHWEAELANVVWMAVRGGVLSAQDAPARPPPHSVCLIAMSVLKRVLRSRSLASRCDSSSTWSTRGRVITT